MEKEKKLLLPYDACEIDAIEGWLDEQARDGWRLESVDGMHFYFTRPDDATLTRYRIDILPKKVPDLAERRATSPAEIRSKGPAMPEISVKSSKSSEVAAMR